MKLHGKKASPPKPISVKIFREDDDGNPANLIFLCGAVLDLDVAYEALCPPPKPPLTMIVATGEQKKDTNDKRYQKSLDDWHERKTCYFYIRSLASTPDLEWETVDVTKPDTFKLLDKELGEFLTPAECRQIFSACYQANAPTENRRKEAIDVFVPTQSEAAPLPSQEEEAINMLSSVPASE